jgi:hypothetical protein
LTFDNGQATLFSLSSVYEHPFHDAGSFSSTV